MKKIFMSVLNRFINTVFETWTAPSSIDIHNRTTKNKNHLGNRVVLMQHSTFYEPLKIE
jgi:hypothetical protein